MSKPPPKTRRIALFVGGDTERGDARRRTLPNFFHRRLDPQLPQMSRVGITAVKFQGVSNYLDDRAQEVGLCLDDARSRLIVNFLASEATPFVPPFTSGTAPNLPLRFGGSGETR
jgi:hypothetical protein